MSETLLYVMAGAVGVSAVALVCQAIFLFTVARSAKRMREQMEQFAPRAEALLESAEKTLVDSRKQIVEVTGKANDVLDTTKERIQRTDEFLAEATERARIQLDRVELVLDDSIGRIHETIVLLNNGVLRPVRELNGIASGIRTAVHFLLRGGRPDISRATTDEEMFI